MQIGSNMAAAAALLTLSLVSCGEADARGRVHPYDWFWNYYDEKWCLSAMTELTECGYPTLEQCNVARAGVGGSCNPNPRYIARLPVRVKKRRYVR